VISRFSVERMDDVLVLAMQTIQHILVANMNVAKETIAMALKAQASMMASKSSSISGVVELAP
jgi:hypothetical protein